MSADPSQNLTITAQCLCKAHSYSTSISRSSLPFQGSICHCRSCRHVTGAMYTSHIKWPGLTREILSSNLARYEFSSNVSLLFCETCSSPLFWEEYYKDKPELLDVFTGALDNATVKNLITFPDQIFVGDTEDGGLSQWLLNVNEDGIEARRWKARAIKSETFDHDRPALVGASNDDLQSPRDILIQCRCKGVDLVLRRSPDDFSPAESSSLPFFVDPTTHRHLATFDACNTCRSVFGAEIVNWTFALLRQMHHASDTEQPGFPQSVQELQKAISSPDRDARLGTLSLYKSSPDVQRYFCSRCSASVFYAVDDRPDLVDVAVGLLDAPEGARAERDLIWNMGSRVGGEDDVVGGWREGFVNRVKETAEKWRVDRGYPKTWRRLAAEKSA
ncbi:CENP-V/GFA domain-containing protein [Fusarium falciforme]|uniref:CENP-V/GFA domain-containing protein n=1 Tax=Fusarium falciforme TaxID=195108 RepID=UPI0023008E5E|nr:CENP-V/GFA domain-containing protein [Fusarium falciforme]WAO95858.1 CENP-V/GFA domain-containing protein [Fusarium falciforme]